MFAPLVVKAQTKTSASSTNNRAHELGDQHEHDQRGSSGGLRDLGYPPATGASAGLTGERD
jgi:hypothetical protein